MDPKDRLDCLAFFWKTKHIPDKDKILIEVNHVNHPHLIFFNVIDESYGEIFMPLMENLREMYRGNHSDDIIPKSKLRLGLPCVVRHENVCFRGVIIFKSSECIKVRTVDYGKDVTITRAEYDKSPLYWLSRSLAVVPIQGIAGRLKFLVPKTNSWTEEATELLMDLLQDREVHAVIINKGLPGGIVDFCLECPETGENIELQLVRSGLADFIGENGQEQSESEATEASEDNEISEIKDADAVMEEGPLEEDAMATNSFFSRAISALDYETAESSYSDDDLNISVHVYSSDESEAEAKSPGRQSELFSDTNDDSPVEAEAGTKLKEEMDSGNDRQLKLQYYSEDDVDLQTLDEVEEKETDELDGETGEDEELDGETGEDEELDGVAREDEDAHIFNSGRLIAPSETLTSVSMVGRLSNVNIGSIRDSKEREMMKQEIVLEMQSLQQRLAELNCILSSEEDAGGVSSTPLSAEALEFVPRASSRSSFELRPDADAFVPRTLNGDSSSHCSFELRPDADAFVPRPLNGDSSSHCSFELRADADAFVPRPFNGDSSSHCSSELRPDAYVFVPKPSASDSSKTSPLRADAESFMPKSYETKKEEEEKVMDSREGLFRPNINEFMPKTTRYSDSYAFSGTPLYQSMTQTTPPPPPTSSPHLNYYPQSSPAVQPTMPQQQDHQCYPPPGFTYQQMQYPNAHDNGYKWHG